MQKNTFDVNQNANLAKSDTSVVAISDALQLLSLIKDIPESVSTKHPDVINSLLAQAEGHDIRRQAG